MSKSKAFGAITGGCAALGLEEDNLTVMDIAVGPGRTQSSASRSIVESGSGQVRRNGNATWSREIRGAYEAYQQMVFKVGLELFDAQISH